MIKEYDYEGHLVKESCYKKGQINGNYKIYSKNGKLYYEGEYSNGRKLKIKEYYENGNIKCEIKYINGEEGNGKEYYEDGKIKYEGEYLYMERNGKGKEYYHDGRLKFEGYYENHERNSDRYCDRNYPFMICGNMHN